MPDTQSALVFTEVMEWSDGESRRHQDRLAAEEPLEIRIDSKPLTVTMRTPGNDEELAAGFLWTEGIIDSPSQIAEIRRVKPDGAPHDNVISVEIADRSFDPGDLQRNFFAASSCGICGKASIDAIRLRGLTPPNASFRVRPELLCDLPARLRDRQQVFGQTGGLHAAGLFDDTGRLLILREDIGRHNAVDKVIGWALMKGLLPLANCSMMVSGRGGFEIVQKAVTAGIPVLASVSAPSSLAVRLAREMSLTLIGFLRDHRFVIYSNPERCLPSEPAT